MPERRWPIPTTSLQVIVLAVVTGLCVRADESNPSSERPRYGEPRRLAILEDEQIVESSGLAASHRHEGVYWTHNDSGDQPRLYAFDREGKKLATLDVAGAEAVDWEDISSFTRGGRAWLLVADVGDNRSQREELSLYLISEPADLDEEEVRVEKRVRFRFDDGPHDCEAIAFDPVHGRVWIVTKEITRSAGVYCLTWPTHPTEEPLVAVRVGDIPILYVTAMDMSSDGRRAIVLGSHDAYEFVRDADETWPDAFNVAPRRISMPRRRQGESICYAADDETLLMTSEKLPTPLWEIRREE